MPTVNLTDALRAEYQQLFDTCQIMPAKAAETDRLCDGLVASQARYETVARGFGMPWYVVAAIHNMECSQNFRQHLHNGDPLTARTRHVPAGRPANGDPPFTWETSATDALAMKKFGAWTDWSIPGMLYRIEGYNGWGYRLYHPAVKSPYLWSGSNQYTSGKYVADGTWSDTARSAQVGAAVLLRRLAERQAITLDSHVADDSVLTAMQKKSALFRYSPNVITPGGAQLQQFLNTFPGIFLKEDGKLGQRTSEAYKRVFGRYLLGDPRG